MRPEIKAAIEALQALENVTIEEFVLIKTEVDKTEEKVKQNECKKIFEEQVCKSNNKLLKKLLKFHKINSISFEKVVDDNEFISSVVFYSKKKSIAFHINVSDCYEYVTTHYNIEISAYARDAQDARENIGFDISDFKDDEIVEFLNIVDSFTKDAYTYGLFVEFE